MTKQEQGNLKEYIRSKDFRYTLVAILVFLGIFLLVSFLWLRLYTHHGQELAMPDYTGFKYEDAVKDAKRNKFRMSIQDSLHILGKPGGEILKQNPAPGSLVKSKRMIYVTITKRSPDKILSSRLPEMYGKSYERKKRELEEHFEIKSRIVDTKYDPGDAGQVLEVRYKGKTIMDAKGRDNSIQVEKGDYLEFVISARSGGKVEVPDLLCKTYEEAAFLLENLGLKIGEVIRDGQIENLNIAYVTIQDPPADGTMIEMESPIQVTVSPTKPASCQ
ncbi:MAG TPA: PASTA domain-containing protein [Saprospiraceae bacterium]|jgi:beta-lactam-binding protein with PASTA domain|nr:PASTA domain-containing protein [Saprospiraceae bacterium]HQW24557.1 PASTA domain-containing protein [Saprospiraceae bacterium]